ncbi:uncharacterized protein LOC112684454 isoform X1 [Sipha flava]|uniref:Uncharacterized protein LOC112684454 isoform X1 n=1 Tax=Sipha flava TaxID=143950 RepID=A0A8B8FN45_9HEMI|nr:uncharacterized protein LOC112684454 isoform X1 [Sipha flava]XP_025411776.1 uncharacterized protein LOC112684454 isoform X1 [Sipha flava]
MNELPGEILLTIFRKLPAFDFITLLPLVCNRWAKLVASDVYTLKSVVMHHLNSYGVFFFSIKGEAFIDWPSEKFEVYLRAYTQDPLHPLINYCDAFYLCTQFTEIYKHIKTLMISRNLSVYPTEGFTYIKNLTTLVFYEISLNEINKHTLLELGSVYANVNEVIYIKCRISCVLDLKCLHIGFKKLKRLRVDHFRVCDKFLDELLKTHRTLESVRLGHCTIMSDRWIDVLQIRLKGQRSIASLDMHSPYFTEKCVKEFLATDNFFLDKKLLKISFDSALYPFFISIV